MFSKVQLKSFTRQVFIVSVTFLEILDLSFPRYEIDAYEFFSNNSTVPIFGNTQKSKKKKRSKF